MDVDNGPSKLEAPNPVCVRIYAQFSVPHLRMWLKKILLDNARRSGRQFREKALDIACNRQIWQFEQMSRLNLDEKMRANEIDADTAALIEALQDVNKGIPRETYGHSALFFYHDDEKKNECFGITNAHVVYSKGSIVQMKEGNDFFVAGSTVSVGTMMDPSRDWACFRLNKQGYDCVMATKGVHIYQHVSQMLEYFQRGIQGLDTSQTLLLADLPELVSRRFQVAQVTPKSVQLHCPNDRKFPHKLSGSCFFTEGTWLPIALHNHRDYEHEHVAGILLAQFLPVELK